MATVTEGLFSSQKFFSLVWNLLVPNKTFSQIRSFLEGNWKRFINVLNKDKLIAKLLQRVF